MKKENSKFNEIQKLIVSHFADGASAEDIAKAIGIDYLCQDSLDCLAELVSDHMGEDADPDDIEGFDEDVKRCALDIIRNEESDLIAKCDNPTMEYCELESIGSQGQAYSWIDENGIERNMSGDIFNYGWHYKAKDRVFFRKDGDQFIQVDWFEIPAEDYEGIEHKRSEFVFVFDTIVTSNCEVVALYDYFA